MNDHRGSTWRKWDLHVHTPASLIHNYTGTDPWVQFLAEVEHLPAEYKVIGINDYIFLDGYRRVVAAKNAGRLKNIDLILPVIELRLDKFGGSKNHLSRVNYHIIFSDTLGADLIEQQFLNAFSSKYTLSPEYEYLRTSGAWKALPTKESLIDLGQKIIDSVPEGEKAKFASPLIEGFNNLCLSLSSIKEALDSHYFNDKFVTAVGKTEWADIKWNDQSIADKKTIINGAQLVFTASETKQHFEKARQSLEDSQVNCRLLDCSDAHAFAKDVEHKDRLGRCLTWIKADPTFEGLQQLLVEFDERHYIGDLPPQVERVRSNPTKYIRSIDIRKKPGATLLETWFNNSLKLNPGLVAVIGNKGKGKSALTDIIGLLANTKQHGYFTFLSSENFRQVRDNKAKHFEATLTLENGKPITKGLEEEVDENQPELVKYIPQNFLEKICTQLGRIEETEFDRELKKVIFSHVEPPYRLGKSSLDELIKFKAAEATQKSHLLKQELSKLNELIVSLEEKAMPAFRTKIENLLKRKQTELEAHEAAKPEAVAKPENDKGREGEIATLSEAIQAEKIKLGAAEENIRLARAREMEVVRLLATANRVSARLDNLERQIGTFTNDGADDLKDLGFRREDIFTFAIDKGKLEQRKTDLEEEQQKLSASFNPSADDNLITAKDQIDSKMQQLEKELDEPNQRYQTYGAHLKNWETRRAEIVGTKDAEDSISFYEGQLEALKLVPSQIRDASEKRIAKAKEIHAVVRELADTYRELYAPVNQFIETRELAKDKFQLNFEVGIVDGGFAEGFFEYISQNPSGTFCGVEQGSKALKAILERQDFNSEAGTVAFLEEIISALQTDQRPAVKAVNVADQLKKSKTVQSLYNFIFSLEYLKPRYALKMGTKELSELSPGERGTLLLVFYLLVDKDDIPLLIDQPEENLDNQTVFELLVPCMKEAKRRRQVFMVTHNPNLAVVCDAEQIICADMDKTAGYTTRYTSGAIENPAINHAIVDVLEGTMNAFRNRREKYFGPRP
jgi:ABC-type lipoprotein export system ATPase subunit